MRSKDNLITFLQDAPSVHIYEGNLDASVCIVGLQSKGISSPVFGFYGEKSPMGPWQLGGVFWRTWVMCHTGSQCDSSLSPN